MLFIKIAFSFPSLILCLIPPTDNRETTEGTPKEDHMIKKALFLRLSPKKVDLIPEKVVFIPKKVDSFPEMVYLSIPKKNRPKITHFLHISKKNCNFAGKTKSPPNYGIY